MSLGALLILVAAGGSGGATAPVPATPPGFDVANSDLVPDQARQFADFPLYNTGDVFDSHLLVGITRRADPPGSAAGSRVRANFVNFIYGRCDAGADGCAPPLEVQIWPACERNLSSYSLTPSGEPLPHENLFVRGVPAAFFDDPRLELYTGAVTIVLFGHDRAQLLRAAGLLRGVNNGVSSSARLPSPAPGALKGALRCRA